jgi:hypothetical protein
MHMHINRSWMSVLVMAASSFPAYAQPPVTKTGDVAATRVCTQISCESAVSVHVPDVRFRAAGKYEFTFKMDKRKPVRCTGELPFTSCDKSAITCNGVGVSISEEGCALPEESQRFGDIHISREPKRLQMRVIHNGREIVKQSWKPHYIGATLNGLNCTQQCRQATVNVNTR